MADLPNKLNTRPPRQTEAELKAKLSKLRNQLNPPAQFALALAEPAAPSTRWLDPAITALWTTMPSQGWAGGVTLYNDQAQPVTFNSLAEMEAATSK